MTAIYQKKKGLTHFIAAQSGRVKIGSVVAILAGLAVIVPWLMPYINGPAKIDALAVAVSGEAEKGGDRDVQIGIILQGQNAIGKHLDKIDADIQQLTYHLEYGQKSYTSSGVSFPAVSTTPNVTAKP
jgi:hypothetical protein